MAGLKGSLDLYLFSKTTGYLGVLLSGGFGVRLSSAHLGHSGQPKLPVRLGAIRVE